MDDRIWMIIVLFFALITALFAALYFSSLVKVPNPAWTYGAIPNKTGTVVKTINVENLGSAMTECNLDSSCKAFSYNSTGGTASFLDVTKPFVDASISDLYQKI